MIFKRNNAMRYTVKYSPISQLLTKFKIIFRIVEFKRRYFKRFCGQIRWSLFQKWKKLANNFSTHTHKVNLFDIIFS